MCVASAWTRFHLRLPTCVAFTSVVILGFPPLDWPQQRRQQQQRLVLAKAEIPTQSAATSLSSISGTAGESPHLPRGWPLLGGMPPSSSRGSSRSSSSSTVRGGGAEREGVFAGLFSSVTGRERGGDGWRQEETNKNLIIAVFSRLTLAS